MLEPVTTTAALLKGYRLSIVELLLYGTSIGDSLFYLNHTNAKSDIQEVCKNGYKGAFSEVIK